MRPSHIRTYNINMLVKLLQMGAMGIICLFANNVHAETPADIPDDLVNISMKIL